MPARIIITLLLLIPTILISIKTLFWGYSIDLLLPSKGYKVAIEMTGNSDQDKTIVKSFIPTDNFRQRIYEISYDYGQFDFAISPLGNNRQAFWQAFEPVGPFRLSYQFKVDSKSVSWEIPRDLIVNPNPSPEFRSYLKAEEMIPLDHPLIIAKHQELIGNETRVYEVIRKTYDYVSGLETLSFKGSTSAVTALVLGKASCNGKSHLMAALLRRSGIPVKLVGGLIMESGNKRISHQWIEVEIAGNWVTFDPTNKHFAHIPAHYLNVYENDEKFFSHSANIGFNWEFQMDTFLSPPSDIYHLQSGAFNFLELYSMFQQANLSMNMLTILLMIPVGGLIATFFRNVIGTQTFGTFLPALIAAASYQTGVVWGLVGFSLIIFVLAGVRLIFEQMDLMHTPKLSAMLTIVVILVLGLTALSVKYTDIGLERISLFPIAIMTLTAERFAITIDERGYGHAFSILLQTLFVTLMCYLFMSNLFLQVSFLAFPELSLMIIGLNLILGRWVGLRMMELYRFRNLIFKQAA